MKLLHSLALGTAVATSACGGGVRSQLKEPQTRAQMQAFLEKLDPVSDTQEGEAMENDARIVSVVGDLTATEPQRKVVTPELEPPALLERCKNVQWTQRNRMAYDLQSGIKTIYALSNVIMHPSQRSYYDSFFPTAECERRGFPSSPECGSDGYGGEDGYTVFGTTWEHIEECVDDSDDVEELAGCIAKDKAVRYEHAKRYILSIKDGEFDQDDDHHFDYQRDDDTRSVMVQLNECIATTEQISDIRRQLAPIADALRLHLKGEYSEDSLKKLKTLLELGAE